MPEADFTKEIDFPGQRSQFVRLTKDGQKIKFRIAKAPFYIGKHWIGEKETVPCIQVNEMQKCEWCEKFEQGVENPYHRSKNYRPTIEFYYAIVNRETHKAEIFQTSISIHSVIKEASGEGIDVFKSDWMVKRNGGEIPVNFYSTIRLDPSPLSVEEQNELKTAKGIDFNKIFNKGKTSSLEESEEEPQIPAKEETADPEEIPF